MPGFSTQWPVHSSVTTGAQCLRGREHFYSGRAYYSVRTGMFVLQERESVLYELQITCSGGSGGGEEVGRARGWYNLGGCRCQVTQGAATPWRVTWRATTDGGHQLSIRGTTFSLRHWGVAAKLTCPRVAGHI